MGFYQELINKIEKLENEDFNYYINNVCFKEIYMTDLFRKALITRNEIDLIDDEQIRTFLNNKLDKLMMEKIRKVNPALEEKTLKEMVSYYHRGIYQWPIDLFVIGDAVFSKEITLDDFNLPCNIRTFMFDNNGTYFDIFDNINFQQGEDIYEFTEKGRIFMSKTEERRLTNFICNNINNALRKEFGGLVCRPIHELNDASNFYGYSGIVQNELGGISVFLDKKYRDIARNIIKKEDTDIKMIVQFGDKISSYNIHQSFNNVSPIWSFELLEDRAWRLSEAAYDLENGIPMPTRKLNKKND